MGHEDEEVTGPVFQPPDRRALQRWPGWMREREILYSKKACGTAGGSAGAKDPVQQSPTNIE